MQYKVDLEIAQAINNAQSHITKENKKHMEII